MTMLKLLNIFFNESDKMVRSVIEASFGNVSGWKYELLNILLWLILVPLAGLLVLAYPFVMIIKDLFGRKQ